MDKFCFNCGEKIEKGARYCPYCGITIEVEEEIDDKDAQIKALEAKISQLEQKSRQDAKIDQLKSQITDLKREMKKPRPADYLCYCCIFYIIIATIGVSLIMASFPYGYFFYPYEILIGVTIAGAIIILIIIYRRQKAYDY